MIRTPSDVGADIRKALFLTEVGVNKFGWTCRADSETYNLLVAWRVHRML